MDLSLKFRQVEWAAFCQRIIPPVDNLSICIQKYQARNAKHDLFTCQVLARVKINPVDLNILMPCLRPRNNLLIGLSNLFLLTITWFIFGIYPKQPFI